MDRSDIARQLAAMRRVVTTRCLFCGEEITGTTYKRYGSDRCRQAARRQRQKDAKAQQQPDPGTSP